MGRTEKKRPKREWKPIATVPRGEEVIVGFDIATVWIVRSAFWDDGDLWEVQGFDSQGELRGWWSYDNSVGQSKLEGLYEPTYWLMETPAPPE